MGGSAGMLYRMLCAESFMKSFAPTSSAMRYASPAALDEPTTNRFSMSQPCCLMSSGLPPKPPVANTTALQLYCTTPSSPSAYAPTMAPSCWMSDVAAVLRCTSMPSSSTRLIMGST